MRFHPKRRASMDHKPGPSMARPTAMAPNRTGTHGSPAWFSTCQTWIRPTNAPTMGVHSPRTRRRPNPIESAPIIAALGGASLHGVKLPRTDNAKPTTSRRKSNPIPGQPPANVEYNRRKRFLPNTSRMGHSKSGGNPQWSRVGHSLESQYLEKVSGPGPACG
jgi:hypothetical protein